MPVSLMRDKPEIVINFNKCVVDLLTIVQKKFGEVSGVDGAKGGASTEPL